MTGRRLALVALALVVLPATVVWRRAVLHRGALQSWAASSSVILRLTGAAAESWVRERTGDLQLLTGDAGRTPPLFRIAVPGQPLMPDSQLKTLLTRAASQLERANGAQYVGIWIIDAQRRPVASSSTSGPPAAARALVEASLATDSVILGRVFVRPDGSTGIGFAQRVLYIGPGHPRSIPANGVLGTIVLVVDPRVSLFPALEGGSIQANDGATTLLMASGDSAREFAMTTGARRAWRTIGSRALPSFERRALSAQPDTTAHLVGGEVVLARPVRGTSWAVLRKARPATVYAGADARLEGECAALVLIVGVAVWLLRLRLRIAQARRTRELAVSERRYRLVTDNATDVIARISADGRVDYVSPAIRSLLGYEPDDVVGCTLADLRHIVDVRAIAKLFDETRRHAGTSRIEHRLRDVAGNEIWVETLARAVAPGGVSPEGVSPESVSPESVSPGDDGDGTRVPGAHAEIVAVTRDITARKGAESALRDTLEFVRAVFESSPVAIIATDLDGRVVQWNRAAERLFGWSAAEIIGEPYPLAPGELWDEMDRLRDRTVLDGCVSDVPVRRQRKDGTLADVAISSGVIYGSDGVPTGFVVLATDLSERIRLEAQLRQSQKMEAVGLLAGGVAHDFNNLLTVVTSYSSLLMRELPDGHSMRDDLSEIHGAAKRGAALVGQLLAFSRQQVLTPQPIDVNALVGGMKQLLKRVLPGKITLQQVLCAGSVVIEADPGQIEQVLLNLVVNARDAIGESAGTITITTACEPRGDATSADGEERDVVITVRDTGCGIPANILGQIFDPFFTTKERGQGTGLGLSTVQGIVAQSSGHISVRSEVGAWTAFELRFPIAKCNPASASELTESGGPTDAAGARSALVLLVEDDPRVRRVTTRILESGGFQVIAAADATEALAIYEEHASRIEIIVTDMMMPDLTGAEMVACIRACGHDVPVLFVSGQAAPGSLAATPVDGCRFIQKPFAPDTLTEKVREIIAHYSAMA